MKKNRKYSTLSMIFLSCCMSAGLGACGNSQHKEVLALAKCMKAANYLEDDALGAAAEYRARTAWKNVQGSAKYAMEVAQELRDEAEPYGSSTGVGHVIKVAQEWKTSSYCQQVETDFAAHIDEQVSTHSQPVIDRNSDPASCQKYVEQFDIYTSRHAAKHHAEMAKVVHASLAGSVSQLKDFQLAAVKARLEGGEFGQLAYETYEQCKTGGALSEKIALAKSVQELKSPATKEIKQFMLDVQNNKVDCGEFPQDYCRATLLFEAASSALAKSEQCDRDFKNRDCAASADELIKGEFQPLEKAQLLSMQEKYTNFVTEPEKHDSNAAGNIYALAEKCKQGAVAKGLRDAAYSSYVAETCMPNARKDYVKPAAEKLVKINARLSS
jgi:hypothetical protein